MTKLSSFLILLFFVTSCGLFTKNSKTKQTEEAYIEEYEGDSFYDYEAELEKHYNPSRTIFTELIHTKLEVNFDWNKSWMNGKATITAKPKFYSSDSLFLDAKGMEILAVKIGNSELRYAYKNDELRIKLDKMYSRNDSYTLVIDYIAKPDERETGGSAAITSDKGLYFINPKGEDKSKMPQIWTQGETEANSVWFPTIDSPNSKSTQEILITVEDKYTTLSNGKLISSTKNANGTRTDHWKQDLPHAPYLFMMGIGEFKIVKDSYTRPDGTKMDVHYYVEPEWESEAKAIFGETPKMIKFFSELTGVEYPWDKYHQIVVRDYVSGAMENTGAVIFGDFAYKTSRELLDEDDNSTIAHELFHHWFGDLVTCESWANLPLNESFANYSQYLWDEHRYGVDEADYNAIIEAQGYFASSENSGHHDLIWFSYPDKEAMFDAHSYNKGGRILHMLRNYLGDEAFFLGIKNYLKTNQFKAAEFHHLRLAFEEVCGEDLNWFFNQWFLGKGHPILSIEQYYSAANQEVVLTVNQNQDTENWQLFRLPVQIAVHDDAGEHIYKAVVDKLENKFVYPVKGTLKSVIFDNQQMLLAEIEEPKPVEQYINQYYLSKKYTARRDAILFGTVEDSPKAEQLILDALKDPHWNVRVEAINKSVFLRNENLKKGHEIVEYLAINDPKSHVRAAAIKVLGEEYEPTKIKTILKDRLENDLSYLVISSALKAYGEIDSKEAMLLAKKLENEKSSKLMIGIAQLYSSHGTKDQEAYFTKLLSTDLTGYDGIYALNYFTVFASRQDESIAVKCTQVYRDKYQTGNFFMKWIIPQNASYMLQNMEERIQKTQKEVELHEKNKDAAYADQARKKLKSQEKIKADLELFLKEISN
jgi:aminopeptidase N